MAVVCHSGKSLCLAGQPTVEFSAEQGGETTCSLLRGSSLYGWKEELANLLSIERPLMADMCRFLKLLRGECLHPV